jgi:hypothetical protein
MAIKMIVLIASSALETDKAGGLAPACLFCAIAPSAALAALFLLWLHLHFSLLPSPSTCAEHPDDCGDYD